MATRKKRLQEVQASPTAETKPKEVVSYQDTFQQQGNKQILEVSKKFEGKGKTLLYALAAVAVLAILIGVIYSWNKRSSGAAQTALGKAIETLQAPVTTQPLPPTYTGKAFKTEKERADAALAEFQAVVDKYGSSAGDKAKYFMATTRLTVDRNAGEQELETLSKTGGEVGTLSKFALAQAKQGDGKYDEATALYNELAQMSDSIIAKDSINFALANVYEKQGKTKEAAALYFSIADAASKAKDLDGKAIPQSQTAREAKDKLQTLDPAKAAEIKEELPTIPS
jgi:tetratricopeptide (TPR) repeat protein